LLLRLVICHQNLPKTQVGDPARPGPTTRAGRFSARKWGLSAGQIGCPPPAAASANAHVRERGHPGRGFSSKVASYLQIFTSRSEEQLDSGVTEHVADRPLNCFAWWRSAKIVSTERRPALTSESLFGRGKPPLRRVSTSLTLDVSGYKFNHVRHRLEDGCRRSNRLYCCPAPADCHIAVHKASQRGMLQAVVSGTSQADWSHDGRHEDRSGLKADGAQLPQVQSSPSSPPEIGWGGESCPEFTSLQGRERLQDHAMPVETASSMRDLLKLSTSVFVFVLSILSPVLCPSSHPFFGSTSLFQA
jgi:hypothetical protein